MKLDSFPSSPRSRYIVNSRSAFTLPEIMIAMTVFIFLVGGIVFANLYGLSMFRITQTKLSATDDARKTIGQLTEEIRTCKKSWVGNVKNGSFVQLLDGEKRVGNALMIFPTTNTANYILYFVNPADQTFRRTTSKPVVTTILAESITNTIVFSERSHSGKILTNNQNNYLVQFNLEFFQPKRHLQVSDYYKLETSVTRRSVD